MCTAVGLLWDVKWPTRVRPVPALYLALCASAARPFGPKHFGSQPPWAARYLLITKGARALVSMYIFATVGPYKQ